MHNPQPKCRYCTYLHAADKLCDPARHVLDALLARGMSFDMPTLEFPDALPAEELGLGGYTLIQQLVVEAGILPDSGGVTRPALIFTGLDIYGNRLVPLLYVGDDEMIGNIVRLVADMAEMAIRRAKSHQGMDAR